MLASTILFGLEIDMMFHLTIFFIDTLCLETNDQLWIPKVFLGPNKFDRNNTARKLDHAAISHRQFTVFKSEQRDFHAINAGCLGGKYALITTWPPPIDDFHLDRGLDRVKDVTKCELERTELASPNTMDHA
jgi:hypothetical protein